MFWFGKSKINQKVEQTNAEIEKIKAEPRKQAKKALAESHKFNSMLQDVKMSNDITLKLILAIRGDGNDHR